MLVNSRISQPRMWRERSAIWIKTAWSIQQRNSLTGMGMTAVSQARPSNRNSHLEFPGNLNLAFLINLLIPCVFSFCKNLVLEKYGSILMPKIAAISNCCAMAHWCATEFLKHAIPDPLVRDTDLFPFRLLKKRK